MQAITEEDSQGMEVDYETKPIQARLTIYDLYDIDVNSILGQGTFSVVYAGIALTPLPQDKHGRRPQSQRVAIKCIPKSKLRVLSDIRSLQNEVNILRMVDHPNIQTLYAYFDEQDHYYLVTERIEGGELFDRIIQKTSYDEAEARDLLCDLVQALDYLHRIEHVAHRDVKPENLVLVGHGSDSDVKLVDFGCANFCVDDVNTGRGNLLTFCGTPEYVAPDILVGGRYGTQVDMWSVGVTLFVLLGGYPPFADDDRRLLYQKIRNCELHFHDVYWNCVGNEAKDLIRGLLTVDPRQRMTAAQVMESDWMCCDRKSLSERDLSGRNLRSLKKYGAIQKIRAAVLSLIAVHKFRNLLVSQDLYVVRKCTQRERII